MTDHALRPPSSASRSAMRPTTCAPGAGVARATPLSTPAAPALDHRAGCITACG
jgi:hypothetical protein